MEENSLVCLAKLLQKKLRDERLTLRQAGELSKISAPTLSRLLRCETIPDTETLISLSKWLKIPIDQLLQVPHQLTFDHNRVQLQIAVHFRGKRKKLEAFPEEANETLVKIIRLAYKQFHASNP